MEDNMVCTSNIVVPPSIPRALLPCAGSLVIFSEAASARRSLELPYVAQGIVHSGIPGVRCPRMGILGA